MLCDYESSVHSSDDGTMEDARQGSKKAVMTKGEMHNMASMKQELSPKPESNKSSPVSSKLPASYSVESKRRSPSREHSSSKRRHKKTHSSRSSHRSSSRHRRSSSRHKHSHRHSKHKHSSRKHHDSHYRDRHSRYRHKHRHYSSTSTSSSSSDTSYDSKSRHRNSPDGKRITQISATIPKDSNSQFRTENHVNSTVPVTSTTRVTEVGNSPAIPGQGVSAKNTVQRLTAQDILDKIQKHQQEQAKAQALAAAAAANLPKYYNPTTVNAAKLAEQQKKRKLLWSKKDNDNTNSDSKTLWATTSLIAGKGDSAAAAKFRKLMGIHDTTEEIVDGSATQADETEAIKRAEAQAELFRRLEHEYEMSRTITHTQRGAGLGFSSASHVDYSAYAAMQPEKDKNPNF